MISAILLAAGESRRMGTFKQLLDYHGKTFVECCVENLLAARLDEVIVVTGYRADDIHRTLSTYPVKSVFNADFKTGMSSSVKCGVRALDEKTEAILMALADQPQITTAVIDKVIDAYRTGQAPIVVATYGERHGHPILVSAELKDKILAVDPEVGLRQVVHTPQTLYVEVGTETVLIDFDYPEDYERLLPGR